MSNYTLRTQQRGYVAIESSYATVPAFAASNAYKFTKLDLSLKQDYVLRRDKSGSRTFPGVVPGGRRSGAFTIDGHIIPNGVAGAAPDMGPLFQGLMGGTPRVYSGGTTHGSTPCSTSSIVFGAAQNLQAGDFIGFNGELRYVSAITAGSPGAATTVTVDPPFSAAPGLGVAISGAVGYPLATSLPSLSLASYWDPSTTQQDIQNGAVVNEMKLTLNGETHDLAFSGPAQQLIDSITFASGQGGLSSFPSEPSNPVTNGVPIAGHKGQYWFGATPAKFATFLSGDLTINNAAIMREREGGSQVALGHAEMVRTVELQMSLYELDDANTQAIRTAAKNRTTIKAYLQLGDTQGTLFAFYIPAWVPQVPTRAEAQDNVEWQFAAGRAQGTSANTEIYLAFG